MIELAAPWLLFAAPVAAVPALLHLVRRRRPRDVPWGAMRFLAVVAAEQRRRLAVQERLLLALRTAALLVAAAAAARPLWVVHPATGPVLERSGRVACVLAIDDSAPTAAGSDAAAVRALALAWLATLRPGDEVSVLPLSRLNEPAVDPLVDLAAARGQIEAVRPSALAPDHPALLLAALDRLQAHQNPHAELVLVAGGRAGGWRQRDARWDELARRLVAPAHGSRARPHVVVLEPPPTPLPDLAITALAPAAQRIAPGVRAPLRVTIASRGLGARAVLVRLAVDGRTVEELAVHAPPEGEAELLVRLPPLAPGDHAITAELIDAGDAFPLSDRRAVVVAVEARLDVLLVEDRPGAGFAGSLGPLALALDPDDGTDPWSPFAPRRVAAARFLDAARAEELLTGAAALVLAGVPALDPATLAVVERFVVGGGGLLVVPGDGIDPAHWSRAWFRAGDGVLPGPAYAMREHHPPLGAMADPGATHPLAELFATAGPTALADAAIGRALELPWPGDGAPEDAEAPLLLDNGAPLLLLRRRGLGRSALLATTLDGGWNALPWRPSLVGLARGLLADLAARPLPPRTLAPLQRPAFSESPGARLHGPTGELPLAPGIWEGGPALLGPTLAEPGVYVLSGPDGALLAQRAVAAAEAALDLQPSATEDAAAADVLGAWRAASPAAADALVHGGARRGAELWPWLALLAAALLLLEGWLCGRAARLERGP